MASSKGKSKNAAEVSIEIVPAAGLTITIDPDDQEAVFTDSQQIRVKEGEKYLVFQIEEKLYGVDSRNISEVANPMPVTPLPNVPSWLMGISNLRGNIIPVVSLKKLWKSDESRSDKAKLVIFRAEEGDSGIAFAVDRLHEMVTLSEKEINSSQTDPAISFPSLIGKADVNSQTVHLLDVDELLNSIKLGNVPV